MNGKGQVFLLKRLFFNKYWVKFLELFVGIVLIYAGISKLSDIFEFSLIVAKYGILPDFLISFFSVIVPFLEIFTGLFLLIGIFKKGAVFLQFLLFSIFLFAVVFVFLKGLRFECGCFEIFGKEAETGVFMVIRNLFLLFIGLNILLFNFKNAYTKT